MAPAVAADDLRPSQPMRIVGAHGNSARDGVKIRRPAAAGFELMIRLIEIGLTSSAPLPLSMISEASFNLLGS